MYKRDKNDPLALKNIQELIETKNEDVDIEKTIHSKMHGSILKAMTSSLLKKQPEQSPEAAQSTIKLLLKDLVVLREALAEAPGLILDFIEDGKSNEEIKVALGDHFKNANKPTQLSKEEFSAFVKKEKVPKDISYAKEYQSNLNSLNNGTWKEEAEKTFTCAPNGLDVTSLELSAVDDLFSDQEVLELIETCRNASPNNQSEFTISDHLKNQTTHIIP